MQNGVVRFDEDLKVERREVADELLQDGIGGVALVLDAEADRDFVVGIVLSERGCYAVVKVRFNPFYRSDNGDGRRIVGELGGHGRRLFARKETEAGRFG